MSLPATAIFVPNLTARSTTSCWARLKQKISLTDAAGTPGAVLLIKFPLRSFRTMNGTSSENSLGTALLPEACRDAEDPRHHAARSGARPRPSADDRDRQLHRAGRRGTDERRGVPHLEREERQA